MRWRAQKTSDRNQDPGHVEWHCPDHACTGGDAPPRIDKRGGLIGINAALHLKRQVISDFETPAAATALDAPVRRIHLDRYDRAELQARNDSRIERGKQETGALTGSARPRR